MHVLFLTHYFPPEVNAPASRTFENARHWVRAGHKVTVITCAPNHPAGVVFPGYRNDWCHRSEVDGIDVLRVKTFLGPNKGFLKRILNYLSYFVSAIFFSRLVKDADVVVSTSPQFFCGMAGFFVSRLQGAPWILEIRDLWPESIKAVGAIRDGRLIRLLEALETWMYRSADRVVAVTDSFREHIAGRGVAPERIAIIKNGADLTQFTPSSRDNTFRDDLGLADNFVASYVGTHGMAHGLDTILEAAKLLRDQRGITFMLVGDGAERENLLRKKEEAGLDNVIMLPQQPKQKMPQIIACSDVSLVLLKKADLFRTVIPSKIFESMAMQRPLILGVEGESRSIVEAGRCGLCIEPENSRALADAVLTLAGNQTMALEMGSNGRKFVSKFYDRRVLANRFLELMQGLQAEEASSDCP